MTFTPEQMLKEKKEKEVWNLTVKVPARYCVVCVMVFIMEPSSTRYSLAKTKAGGILNEETPKHHPTRNSFYFHLLRKISVAGLRVIKGFTQE